MDVSLKNMKDEMSKTMSKMFGKMMGLAGKDLLTAEQITKYLTEAFGSFDRYNSGKIDFTEFSNTRG